MNHTLTIVIKEIVLLFVSQLFQEAFKPNHLLIGFWNSNIFQLSNGDSYNFLQLRNPTHCNSSKGIHIPCNTFFVVDISYYISINKAFQSHISTSKTKCHSFGTSQIFKDPFNCFLVHLVRVVHVHAHYLHCLHNIWSHINHDIYRTSNSWGIRNLLDVIMLFLNLWWLFFGKFEMDT